MSAMAQGPKFTKENLPDWFCPVPFAGIIFNPEGNVTACRELGASHWLGDIRKESWQEIWNGEGFRSLRREFLTGNVRTCATHIRHRKCHKDFWNRALLEHIDLSEIQAHPPIRISPDFNGRCNLECEMCVVWKKPNGLYDELEFWDDAEKSLFPFLQQVDPLSGEPFVQKDTYRLMEFMAKTNPKAAWKITTNAHWKFTPYIRERLDGINLWRLNISVDSLDPENYARIRKGGDLKLVLKTIDDLVRYREERIKAGGSEFIININTLAQVHNWWEMGDFVKFVRDRKSYLFPQFLYEPEELSLLSLSAPERREIMEHYWKTIPAEFLVTGFKRVWNPIVESVRKDYGEVVLGHRPGGDGSLRL
jgi:cyclic pyranopterin phosphate synthase